MTSALIVGAAVGYLLSLLWFVVKLIFIPVAIFSLFFGSIVLKSAKAEIRRQRKGGKDG